VKLRKVAQVLTDQHFATVSTVDTELAATLAEIIWATLYLKAQPAR